MNERRASDGNIKIEGVWNDRKGKEKEKEGRAEKIVDKEICNLFILITLA